MIQVLQSAAEDLNDTPPVEDITDLSSWQWFYQVYKSNIFKSLQLMNQCLKQQWKDLKMV